MNNKRNTEAIVKIAKKKSDETRYKVEKTIPRLILEGLTINFNVVSNEAGVSKAWLYNNEDIRRRIEDIRDKQKIYPKRTLKVSNERSEASKDAIITTFKERIKQLENENKQLHKQLEMTYGTIYNKL
ncbi:DUF6262 family protein [Clostridium estertheticum]|uniref:DUF6262 family protein n=1 Tax=Clostridium estertheticum TaxID=238834 RepID=A0AA47EJ81_9CLOT|nr:DUF6262 family protein [Clostridium estertheticum]MBU3153527.1 transposase [Clostridium estertheticum]WAG60926.1 DUF6262 family protein [Clostridium estertheticum]